MSHWFKRPNVRGIILDIHGVLYDSGSDGGCAIPGSVEAVNRLRSCGIELRFCSNESSESRSLLVNKLHLLGFEVEMHQLFTPAPSAAKILQQRNLRPFLLVHPDVREEFDSVDQTNPNCVVIGDAKDHFSYDGVNRAFRCLMGAEDKLLFTMGYGKYYRETDGLQLDLGAYAKALEYACDCTAEVVGKPSVTYFNNVVDDMNVPHECVVMIGDDLISDIGGSQATGMRGILVRTGKYQPSFENHQTVKPDLIVDNLAVAVELFLSV